MTTRTPDEQARVDAVDRAMRHWHLREIDEYLTLYHADAILHHTHGDFDVAGARADYLQLFGDMPDAAITFDHVLVENDLVAMNFTLSGTSGGERAVTHGLSLLRFDGLRCAERWTSSH